jgi:hypothetical protein
MKKYIKTLVAVFVIGSFFIVGCSASNAVKGGAIGATGGGLLGGVIGHAAGNTTLGEQKRKKEKDFSFIKFIMGLKPNYYFISLVSSLK